MRALTHRERRTSGTERFPIICHVSCRIAWTAREHGVDLLVSMYVVYGSNGRGAVLRFERRRRRREQVSASQSVSSSFFTRTRPARGCVRCVSAITFQIKFITAMMHPRCTRHYTGNSYLSDSV